MRVCSFCRRCYADSIIACTDESHPALSETRKGDPEMVAGYSLDLLHEFTGSSETYRATQKISGQSCLIKILSTDGTEARKFLDEAKIATAFFHPNVADTYETGISNIGDPFVVMEDVDGQTLREHLLSVGVPPLLTAVQIARQTAEALYAIHLNGLTHRAIDPGNIILAKDIDGRLQVKIQNFDFGGVGERFIASNRFLGEADLYALRYFAPEQCAGQTASPQTDVYSLGVVFYEMLAGVPPFEGQTAAALIDQHRNRPVPEIRIDNFDLRMLITHALTEALQKRPKVRQLSANAFARQFRHIEQLGTHSSTPPPAGTLPPPRKIVAGATDPVSASVAPTPVRDKTIARTEPVYEERVRPSAVKVELQPVYAEITNDAASRIWDENESPAPSLMIESEPVSFARENPGENSPDLTLKKPAAENVVHQKTDIEDKRSRLRLRKKIDRAKTAMVSFRTRRNKASVPPELTGLEPVYHPCELTEAPVFQSEQQTTTVVPFQIKARKIEWQQPDDDIPSEAAVLEALASEQIFEAPLAERQPETIQVAIENVPILIEESPRPDDISSKDEVLGILPMEDKPEHSPALAEEEEITQVQPEGRRIKIEWEQPALHLSDEIQFVPTILGGRGKSEPVDLDTGDSMFTSVSGLTPQFQIPRRSLFVGGGLMLLIALFLFGNVPLRNYFQSAASGETIEAKTILPNAPRIGQPSVVSISKKKTQKSTEKPATQANDVDDGRSKPAPAKERSTHASDKQENTTIKAKPLPATLVIYSENGKTKSKYIAAGSKGTDEKPMSLSDKTANPGRPRIVKEPKR